MVVSGLSSRTSIPELESPADVNENNVIDERADIVDAENPNIVTTYNERILFEKICSIIGPAYELQAKDTESYYSILFQGKTNRWLVRYYDKKNRSNIQLPIDINEITGNEIKRAGLEHDNNRIFIEHPEDVLRISGLILDSLQYVQNDENFRKRRP